MRWLKCDVHDNRLILNAVSIKYILQMEEARPIPPFRCDSIEKRKLSREWETWKGSLQCYFEAYAITDQRMMKAKLLHLGGVELQRVFRSLPDHDKFPVVALEPKFYELAVDILDGYFLPGRQDVIERRKLRHLKQESGEKFSHFLIRLRQQVSNCGFEKYPSDVCEILKEIYLIDIIVENCQSEELRKSILRKDRTLIEIEEIAACIEGTEQQLKDLKESTVSNRETAVYEVRGKQQAFRPRRPTETRFSVTNSRSGGRRTFPPRDSWRNDDISCFACGEAGHMAKSSNCPARGRTCRRCQQLGHYEAMCRKRKAESGVTSKPRKVFSVDNQAENDKPESEKIDRAETEQKVYYAFYGGNETNVLPGIIGGVCVELLVDSGADVNLIKQETWEVMKQSKVRVIKSVKGCTKTLKGYGSDKPLAVIGSFEAEIVIGTKSGVAEFFVVKGGQKDLLGDLTAKQLGVLKIGLDINNVASSLGKPFTKITNVQAHIRTHSHFKPIFQPLRRVPIPMEEAVNKKLDQLLARDIIEVKQGPVTWVSPLVIVGKASGEPRICLDLRRVNEAVVRERFPMPVVEEYLARLGKGRVWSKLDIREAFHQVELAEDSRDITTFITSRGLFRFKRLPFGLVTAPEIFQRVMEELLSGCDGTFWYLDDVIVEGETQEAHDVNLKQVE